MTGAKARICVLIHNRQRFMHFGRNERELIRRAAEAAYARGAVNGASGVISLLEDQKDQTDAKRAAKQAGRRVAIRAGKRISKQAGRRVAIRAGKRTGRRRAGLRRNLGVNGKLRCRDCNRIEVNLTITDDEGIRVANREFMGIDKATDVLSFPLINFQAGLNLAYAAISDPQTGRTPIGDIMISAERAYAQAEEYGHSYERELGFLTAHGILHLLGYDHAGNEEADMFNITEQALAQIGLSKPETGSNNNSGSTAAHNAGESAEAFRSGFFAVLGKPNVGKSTLINTLCGNSFSIVSHKPQTTRRNAKMILTTDGYQLVFIDTPGLHVPKNRLGERMARYAKAAIKDVDAVLLMIDARDSALSDEDKGAISVARAAKIPVVLIINKIDLIKKENLLPLISHIGAGSDFACIIPISAVKQSARRLILTEIAKLAPPGGLLYPEDMLTDQTERRLAEDIIREKALKLLDREVPHGIEVSIDKFHKRERDGLYEIGATLFCEREAHKKIIIGKNGAMLKRIGATARLDIERLVDSKTYLELWVKTLKDWRDNDAALKRMGYYTKI